MNGQKLGPVGEGVLIAGLGALAGALAQWLVEEVRARRKKRKGRRR